MISYIDNWVYMDQFSRFALKEYLKNDKMMLAVYPW